MAGEKKGEAFEALTYLALVGLGYVLEVNLFWGKRPVGFSFDPDFVLGSLERPTHWLMLTSTLSSKNTPEKFWRNLAELFEVKRRFDKPFYYGRLGNMALILIFGTPEWLRFFCSPSGGGGSLLPEKSCPAWDFEWVIPNEQYEVGREYELKMRLIYKQFISDADILAEYQAACDALDINLY